MKQQESELAVAPGPTEIAEKLTRLKRAMVSAAETRTRLPVPLYWSLFHSQVKEVRKVKARERLLRTLFIGSD